jgi:hypothetical protein
MYKFVCIGKQQSKLLGKFILLIFCFAHDPGVKVAISLPTIVIFAAGLRLYDF